MLVDVHSGEVLRANEAAVDFFGQTGARLVAMRLSELIEDRSERGRIAIQHQLATTPLPLTQWRAKPMRGLSASRWLMFCLGCDGTATAPLHACP